MKVDQCNKKRLFCCVRFLQRFTSLALILVLLPFMLAIPARADTDDSFLNVLDFAVTEETGNNSITLVNGVATASYTLPWRMSTQYVDVLFTFYETTRLFDSIEVYHSNGTTLLGSLNVERVNDNVWRAFGNITSTYTTKLSLRFQITGTQGTHITIYQFNISPMSNIAQKIPGYMLISSGSYTSTINYNPTDETNERTWVSNNDSPTMFSLWVEDWYLYDYLDFSIALQNVSTISSINAHLDGLGIPFTISQLPGYSLDFGFYAVNIRLDLRNINRAEYSYSEVPRVVINCLGDSGTNYAGVYSIYGIVSTDSVSPLAFWFNQIGKWISAQTSSITGSITGLGDNINGMLTSMTNTILGSLHSIGNSIRSGVDEIVAAITGGDQADDLKDGADQIGEAGSSLGDNIGSIHEFEDQYFGQLDTNMGSIVAAGNISGIVAPLAFVQRYANLIVAGIPSNYLVIFTLPVLLGIFMYIVGHPIKAPRPDTSGDTVTRESFTETTILSGPGAGRTRSTRTVTTSTEIGRVHNE